MAQSNSTDSTQSIADSLKPKFKTEAYLSRWVLDGNFLIGALTQQLAMHNTAPNYENGVNMNTW